MWGQGDGVWHRAAKPPGDQVGPGAPAPAQRRAPELRDGGTRAGHGRAAPRGDTWLRVGFVRPPAQVRLCVWLGLCIHTCAHRSCAPGEGEQPPESPSGDSCSSRTPRARLPDAATAARAVPPGGVVRQGGERGERRGEPRPDTATISGTVGCLFPTLPSRLRRLICCVRLSLSVVPLPRLSPRPCRERMREASGSSSSCMS